MAGNPFQHEAARIDRGRTLVDTDNEARTLAITPEGYLSMVSRGNINTESVVNSTIVTLGIGESFVGDWEEIKDYALIKVFVYADQDAAEMGLIFQQSPDQVVISDDTYEYKAGTKKLYTINPVPQYFRINFTNGSVAQTSFVIQTIFSPVYAKPTTHRIGDDVTGNDDTELVTSILKVKTNDEETYRNIDAQNPLPTDGDSVYGKDLYLPGCDAGDFVITVDPSADETEVLTSMVSDVWLEKKNVSVTNPKIVTLAFRRPVLTTSFGIDSGPDGTFSNVKIYIKQGQEEILVIDDSADNTKHKIQLFATGPLKFSEMRFEFHTADTITTGLYGIFKHHEVAARLQALKPDGTVTDIDATNGGNLKTSIEELESDISVNSNTQLKITKFNSDGFEQDMDLNGLTLSREFLTEVKLGHVPGHKLVHKFGHNSSVGTTPVPIAVGGVYQTPPANATLEVLSDDADDTAAGLGAQEITIQGLVLSNGLFVTQEEIIELNGLTPVTLVNEFIRIFRVWISRSGTYVNLAAVSGQGTITVRGVGGGITWLQIDEFVSGNSSGQSQTALYTTPSATKSILFSPQFTIDSSKSTSLYFFHRPNADDVVAPFTGARRMVHEWLGMTSGNPSTDMLPVVGFVGAIDMGFLAEVAVGTGAVSAEFWLLEIETT